MKKPMSKSMNASQLIDGIERVCRDNHVEPKDVTINYRHDGDSDIWCVRDVQVDVTQPDNEAIAKVLRHIDGRGGITGKAFIERLRRRCERNKVEPQKVKAEFHVACLSDGDGGLSYRIRGVEEDLFDAYTGNVLETIMLVSKRSN